MKTLFLLNHAPFYRKAIFKLIDSNFNCDFAFGFIKEGDIRTIDKFDLINSFTNLKTLNFYFFGLYYILGSLRLSLFGNYQRIVLTGEFRSLSSWAVLIFNLILLRKKTIFLWTHGY